MPALWTSEDAAAATGGRSAAVWQATGVSIDTRSLQPGDLFVALKDQRDAHDFVVQALEKGAAAALVSRIPEGLPEDAPLLVVPDVLQALEALGRAARARTGAKVIGVTGSVGKTSTKEMLRAVLQGQGRVHAAEASYNNHWGVPLTLARMPADSDFAVIEIGMNHPGEIGPLARLARPHIALITTIAAAHLEAFEDTSGIAEEKAAIMDGLEPGGIAILPADLDVTPLLVGRAEQAGARTLLFGTSAAAPYRLIGVQLTPEATIVRATRAGEPLLYKVRTPGRHFATNALAVLAAADALGLDPIIAACDIGQWSPPAGRGTRERILIDAVEDDAFELIDDAFNANPASMAASLELLAAMQPTDNVGRISSGRRIAILGDMLELGRTELALHRAIADHPALSSIAVIHCVGPRMRVLWEALPKRQRGDWAETAAELLGRVHLFVDAGDIVLVKGSKSMKVSLLVDALRKLGKASPSTIRGDE
ncbi:UDP-N-acetylmuramoyl-tripeptide--D-alanyl-D-alanine ligase [Cereibacter changlensis JA139]|uniref:UDP-N-acetylmuramoyl-tripeptide--D-alanyl-D-alanine ligase n=2 Tax=Cereibacter changlensis TaxID=402884 RepID=A0A2T4JQ39_9RHOB|nr:UDP-N-acetylmuramoyl-tripeptide--D-alanyl-D-alanine ligase [Cereibacter changlensis]PTE20028.1 UDP-N-acetylmuramoyl-tripeptide--D-alanyl-D-alanine ligase [Cereibacter changlensis JA139]PZX53738.1 UDP-N-acetylmuramoyl-tripeptide--D-alanyl-D-alanine ligase [Cereibacter changlensis]